MSASAWISPEVGHCGKESVARPERDNGDARLVCARSNERRRVVTCERRNRNAGPKPVLGKIPCKTQATATVIHTRQLFHKPRRDKVAYLSVPFALTEIKKLLDQYLSINEILKSNPAAFGAEQKSKANYYQAMDEFLAKVGYEEYDPAEEMEMKKAKKGILEILNEWYGKKY